MGFRTQALSEWMRQQEYERYLIAITNGAWKKTTSVAR